MSCRTFSLTVSVMSDRLSLVSDQLETLGQIESVMSAMQGIASARRSEAQTSLDGIKSYAATIANSIGITLAALKSKDDSMDKENSSESELVIVLSAEQGFAGAYNERLLDVAIDHVKSVPESQLLVVGNRGQMIARNRQTNVFDSLPMVTRVQAIPTLANELVEALYTHLNHAQFTRVSLIHPFIHKANTVDIIKHSLLPFDYARFELPPSENPPLLTLEPTTLLTKLATEYIYSELCQALVLAHAAENEERIRAMVRARSNIRNSRERLTVDFQQLRQEQITAEIAELTTGRIAGQ